MLRIENLYHEQVGIGGVFLAWSIGLGWGAGLAFWHTLCLVGLFHLVLPALQHRIKGCTSAVLDLHTYNN